MEEYLETFVLIITIVGPIVGAFYAWLKSLKKCVDKNAKRTWRQSKSLILLANRLDDLYDKNHSGGANLGRDVETILKDNNGEL